MPYHYCHMEVKVQVPPLAFSYTTPGGRGKSPLILLGEVPLWPPLTPRMRKGSLSRDGYENPAPYPPQSSLTAQGWRRGKKEKSALL